MNKFQLMKFKVTDLDDIFFDSLKADYQEFSDWFTRKAAEGEEAYIYRDDEGIKAFLYLKNEYQCHLDKVFYDENSISYAVMH